MRGMAHGRRDGTALRLSPPGVGPGPVRLPEPGFERPLERNCTAPRYFGCWAGRLLRAFGTVRRLRPFPPAAPRARLLPGARRSAEGGRLLG